MGVDFDLLGKLDLYVYARWCFVLDFFEGLQKADDNVGNGFLNEVVQGNIGAVNLHFSVEVLLEGSVLCVQSVTVWDRLSWVDNSFGRRLHGYRKKRKISIID